MIGIFFILLIATIGISMYGFNNPSFFEHYMFNIRAVQGGDYIRLISSGFLHASWEHLIFNMISLYFFQDRFNYCRKPLQFLYLQTSTLLLCHWSIWRSLWDYFCLYCNRAQPKSKFHPRLALWYYLFWIFCL